MVPPPKKNLQPVQKDMMIKIIKDIKEHKEKCSSLILALLQVIKKNTRCDPAWKPIEMDSDKPSSQRLLLKPNHLLHNLSLKGMVGGWMKFV